MTENSYLLAAPWWRVRGELREGSEVITEAAFQPAEVSPGNREPCPNQQLPANSREKGVMKGGGAWREMGLWWDDRGRG